MTKDAVRIIRYIYLYLVTAIGIVLILVSAIGLLKIVLEEYVFDVKGYEEEIYYSGYSGSGVTAKSPYYECDDVITYDTAGKPVVVKELTDEERAECEEKAKENREMQHMNSVKRDLVWWLSMLLIGLPVYFYHWGVIQKRRED